MAISVTKFKNSCLDVIRRVEMTGQAVAITRRGKVVARIAPSVASVKKPMPKPWEQLRSLGGRLVAAPGESVASDKDFKALR
jgi:prevent-host-death family protein